jgi:hypothetical protein
LAAQAQTAGPSNSAANAKVQPTSLSTTKPANLPALQPSAAPGTEIYTAKRGDTAQSVSHHYLSRTSYLTYSQLTEAIRRTNGDRKNNVLKTGENIVIPGILPAPIVEKTIPISKDFEVRAIYLTGIMAGSDHGIGIIRHWRDVGGNAVVFDVKDSDGTVTIPFEHPLVGKHNIYIHDVPKFIHFLHSQNMHAIARIAIFRDEALVKAHPELAVQSRRNKTAWRENGKLVWTDPSQPKVQDYNIALAKYVAQLGADEIQFDYVRFPAEGDQKDASFVFQNGQPEVAPVEDASTLTAEKDGQECSGAKGALDETPKPGADPAPKGQKNAAHGPSRGKIVKNESAPNGRKTGCSITAKRTPPRGPQRSDVITAFLKKAHAELHPTGVLLSLDVFGVMAWQRPIDLSHTGQDIVAMARHCDILSPMIYPSHFFGMDKIPHPGDAPEHFIGESMDRFELITKDSGVVIRPWLQAFHWRTKTYSPEYIKVQVLTAKNKGGIGFLFWNAANDYSKPFIAMPEMKAANAKEKDRFFRGDELPIASERASLGATK